MKDLSDQIQAVPVGGFFWLVAPTHAPALWERISFEEIQCRANGATISALHDRWSPRIEFIPCHEDGDAVRMKIALTGELPCPTQ